MLNLKIQKQNTMKKLFPVLSALTAVLFISFRLPGVVGSIFPDMPTESLEGKKVNLPNDTKGKSTIIALAYSKDAEEDLNTWLTPAYDKFVAKNEIMSYDVNLYFVPMFTGAKAASASAAKEKIKKDTDAELLPYILIYKGDLEKYKTALQMENKNTPYIFVLDKNGKIVYSTSGPFSDDKIDAVEDNLD